MIYFLRKWCEGIVVAIIISIIIETLMPEGNNKKYVKIIIGIYVVFTILNPLLTNINSEIDISSIADYETVEVSSIDSSNIKDLYVNRIGEIIKIRNRRKI